MAGTAAWQGWLAGRTDRVGGIGRAGTAGRPVAGRVMLEPSRRTASHRTSKDFCARAHALSAKTRDDNHY